jgi:hypothetical protein
MSAYTQKYLGGEYMQRIKLPKKVLPVLEKWFDEDISKETTVPHTFEEGYLFFEDADTLDDNAREEIKYIAKKTHAVYRNIENMYKMLNGKETILYFKFLNDNELYIERYTDKMLIQKGKYNTERISSLRINSINLLLKIQVELIGWTEKTAQEYLKSKTDYCVAMLVASLWYIATTKSTKYIHNEVAFPLTRQNEKKTTRIKEVTSKKITTPIYDLGKTRVVSLDILKKRKKGWTYSHAFNVRGHYRHYRSGKVVFIKSFVKCKDLEMKDTEIIVSPEEEG